MDGKVHRSDELTSRQRLLAAYRGAQVDRLPFWAKVDNTNWRLGQTERVRRLPSRELMDLIGADGIFGSKRFVRRRPARVTQHTSEDGRVRTIVTRTPDGDLSERWTMDPRTGSWHPTEYPVKTREDLRRFRWVYTDVSIDVDEDALAEAIGQVEQIGQRGITKTGWGTSPLMHLVEHVLGPVNAVYFLADYRDEMDALIEQMHQVNLALVRALAERTPADLVVSVENTSTTLINPELFTRYCLGHLRDYGRAIEQAGKVHELHMCGQIAALLEAIETIPAGSIEAFTAPSLGNTRLVDGRRRAPSKTLVGGTHAMLWLKDVASIRAFIDRELAACDDRRRIVLTTAGEAPPGCPPETFRAISQYLAGATVGA